MTHIIGRDASQADKNIRFDPASLREMKCPHCGSQAFLQTAGYRLSPSVSNSKGEDIILGVDSITCVSCRRSYVNPTELKVGGQVQ